MIPGKPHQAPISQIWFAAYFDSKTEYFEIRTRDPRGLPDHATLWHKEYPLGSSVTDYLYVNLSALDDHLEQMKAHVDAINADCDVDDHFERLFDIAMFWLKQNPLFTPLVVSAERLHLVRDRGETLSVDEIEAMMGYCKTMQERFQQLANRCFETDAATDMTLHYLGLQRNPDRNYPELRYGKLQVEEVVRGRNMPSLYDNLLEFAMNGEEIKPDDYFATEVLNSDDPNDLVGFVLSRYLRENLRFHICKYCGKYFGITNNYKSEYCDRQIEGSSKTCKEIGSFRLYEKRKMEDPVVREYKRSYKAHNARIRYGLMTKEEFTAWSLEARKRRDQCVAGKLSLEEFVFWLDSDKR